MKEKKKKKENNEIDRERSTIRPLISIPVVRELSIPIPLFHDVSAGGIELARTTPRFDVYDLSKYGKILIPRSGLLFLRFINIS